MKKGLISVIVPIYNAEPFLEQCISTIVNQTYKNLQIILINDGSKDKSLEICKSFSAKDNRIVVIDQKNKGVSGARYAGYKVAEGEFLAFVDSDDYIKLDMCEKLYDAITKEEAEVAVAQPFCCETEYVAGGTKGRYCLTGLEASKRSASMDKRCFRVLLWDKLWEKSLFEQLNFDQNAKLYPQLFFEDCYLVPILLLNCKKIVKVNESCNFHRIDYGNTVSSTFNLHVAEFYKVSQAIIDLYEKGYQISTHYLLRGLGNNLIKAWMQTRLNAEFSSLKNIYEQTYRDWFWKIFFKSKSSVAMRASFLLFRISPELWEKVGGRFYKKNYAGLTKKN